MHTEMKIYENYVVDTIKFSKSPSILVCSLFSHCKASSHVCWNRTNETGNIYFCHLDVVLTMYKCVFYCNHHATATATATATTIDTAYFVFLFYSSRKQQFSFRFIQNSKRHVKPCNSYAVNFHSVRSALDGKKIIMESSIWNECEMSVSFTFGLETFFRRWMAIS